MILFCLFYHCLPINWSDDLYNLKFKMEMQKNTRRKRKDPQSRDFTCICGRSYLSYAAAYTHVKNKHQLDKKFLDAIGKPPREKLPRGRPRDKKEIFTTREIQRLSVIEDTILKMHEILGSHFPKMILEGNKILTAEERKEADQTVMKSLHLSDQLKLVGTSEDHEFIKQLNRHFAADIVAKVKFIVLSLSKYQKQREKEQQQQNSNVILNDLNKCNFWEGCNEVNQIIAEAVHKWKELKEG